MVIHQNYPYKLRNLLQGYTKKNKLKNSAVQQKTKPTLSLSLTLLRSFALSSRQNSNQPKHLSFSPTFSISVALTLLLLWKIVSSLCLCLEQMISRFLSLSHIFGWLGSGNLLL